MWKAIVGWILTLMETFSSLSLALSLSLSLAAPSAPFTTSLKAFVQVQRKFTKKAINECYSAWTHIYTHPHTKKKIIMPRFWNVSALLGLIKWFQAKDSQLQSKYWIFVTLTSFKFICAERKRKKKKRASVLQHLWRAAYTVHCW